MVPKFLLRWFPSFQVATTCLSCSPPDLNFLVTFFFIFVYMQNNHCHRVTTQLSLINIIIIIIIIIILRHKKDTECGSIDDAASWRIIKIRLSQWFVVHLGTLAVPRSYRGWGMRGGWIWVLGEARVIWEQTVLFRRC